MTSHERSAPDRAVQVLLTLIDVSQSENVVMDVSALFDESERLHAAEPVDTKHKGMRSQFWSLEAIHKGVCNDL